MPLPMEYTFTKDDLRRAVSLENPGAEAVSMKILMEQYAIRLLESSDDYKRALRNRPRYGGSPRLRYTGNEDIFTYEDFVNVMIDIDDEERERLSFLKRTERYKFETMIPVMRSVIEEEMREFKKVEGYPFTTDYTSVLASLDAELLKRTQQRTKSGRLRVRIDHSTMRERMKRSDRYLGILSVLVKIREMRAPDVRGSMFSLFERQYQEVRRRFMERYVEWANDMLSLTPRRIRKTRRTDATIPSPEKAYEFVF